MNILKTTQEVYGFCRAIRVVVINIVWDILRYICKNLTIKSHLSIRFLLFAPVGPKVSIVSRSHIEGGRQHLSRATYGAGKSDRNMLEQEKDMDAGFRKIQDDSGFELLPHLLQISFDYLMIYYFIISFTFFHYLSISSTSLSLSLGLEPSSTSTMSGLHT